MHEEECASQQRDPHDSGVFHVTEENNNNNNNNDFHNEIKN